MKLTLDLIGHNLSEDAATTAARDHAEGLHGALDDKRAVAFRYLSWTM